MRLPSRFFTSASLSRQVKPSRWQWLLFVAALAAIDQASKAYFSATIELFGIVEVTPWFNLVHTLNEGAAFSFLADAGGWQRLFLIAIDLPFLQGPINSASFWVQRKWVGWQRDRKARKNR